MRDEVSDACVIDAGYCSPPDVVDDALCHPFESFLVSQHVHNSRGAERMASSNNILSIHSTFPSRPVYILQTMSTGSLVSLSTHVLLVDFFTVAGVYRVDDLVCFFDLSQTEIKLSAAEFTINSLVIVRTCIPGVV